MSSITIVEPKVTKPPMSANESMKRRRLARKKAATGGKPERTITKQRQPAWKGGGETKDGKTFRERNDAAAKELREKRKAAAEKAPAHNPHYVGGADEGTEGKTGDVDDAAAKAAKEAAEKARLDAQKTAGRKDGANERKG